MIFVDASFYSTLTRSCGKMKFAVDQWQNWKSFLDVSTLAHMWAGFLADGFPKSATRDEAEKVEKGSDEMRCDGRGSKSSDTVGLSITAFSNLHSGLSVDKISEFYRWGKFHYIDVAEKRLNMTSYLFFFFFFFFPLPITSAIRHPYPCPFNLNWTIVRTGSCLLYKLPGMGRPPR